jgi:hypothetical protein
MSHGGGSTCHVNFICFGRDPWRNLVPCVKWYEFHESFQVADNGRDTCDNRWLVVKAPHV